ncbi:hypothetical protein PIB30_047335 [Stylosanthes scabra]|uniref:Uncharacterized protein n=1 Tax=Stylosanthes scabra TaxID=79078 RepID=A0ABU6RHB9_9FABA|nr:hypothetical protein [Stylosanthes scabra]
MKEEIAILSQHQQVVHPREKSKDYTADEENKLDENNTALEEDTDVSLGANNPDDTGTLVNGKSREIRIINLDGEIIAQSENVNYTRARIRSKEAKSARYEELNPTNNNFMEAPSLGRKRGRLHGPDSKIQMLAACKNLTGNHNEIGHMVRQCSNARWKALVSK